MWFSITSFYLTPKRWYTLSSSHQPFYSILNNTSCHHIPKTISYPCCKFPTLLSQFVNNNRLKLSYNLCCLINRRYGCCCRCWCCYLSMLNLSHHIRPITITYPLTLRWCYSPHSLSS